MENTTEVKKEVTLTRNLNAPRELVWKAWTEVEHMQKWWGPSCFTNPVCEMDVRPCGLINIHMQAPDGTVYPMGGVFKEIDEPTRLVFTTIALGADGEPMFENINTITFIADGDKTLLTVHTIVDKVSDWEMIKPMIGGMEQGWSQSLERLEELVIKI